MSYAHTVAAGKRWEKIDPTKRSKIMAERGRQRWSKISPEDRKAHALMMIRKRERIAH